MTKVDERINWAKGDGLVPAVVQDAVSGRVLMLGYMTSESLAKTVATGLVTFYSRSRQCLWTKGEESGNTLALHDVQLDCDGDTLLILACPTGPTCHLEKVSCFDTNQSYPGFGYIGQLEDIIEHRLTDLPEHSYAAKLARSGIRRCAQKIGEEGVEVALAAVAGNREEITEESADLLFHLLILLKQHGLGFLDVTRSLRSRNSAD